MKITVYTITDCQFSKQEIEYLKAHNLQYEEKNLELHREFLSEMLNISNNFAGTPVTKIEKDDGKIVVLKGFTTAEFDEALGFKKDEKKDDTKKEEAKPADSKPAAVATPAAGTPPSIQPTAQPAAPATPPAVPAAPPPATTDPMASLSGGPPSIPDLGPSMTTSQGISVDPSMPATPEPMPTIELPALDAAPTDGLAMAQPAVEAPPSTTDADLDAILKDLEMKAGATEPAAPATVAPGMPAQPVAAAPTTPPTTA